MPDRPVPPPRAAEGLVYTPQPDPGWSLAGPERRAAREEAAALRAERDRASRLLDDEGTARVVAAADRLRALETAQNHAIAAELRRMAEQWDHEVAGARKRTAAMAAAEGWDDEDEHLNGRLDGKLSCAEDARRRAAELEATEPAPVEPQRQAWRIAVDVPLDAPGRDALFAAIANVVADWEPARRDGWDAHVYAEPVTVPAWKLAPDRDPTADAAEPRYQHGDGRPCHGCQTCLDGEHEPATSRHEGSP